MDVKIPHLLGGVSQLPAEQRPLGTVDLLENALISKQYGLRKRPPTEGIGRLLPSQAGYEAPHVFGIDRTDDEKHIVLIANGDIKVFDTLTGEEQLVQFVCPKDYLSDGSKGFRACTVGDHTFIVNRAVTTKKGTRKSTAATVYGAPMHEALIFVRQGDYSTRYQVGIDGENAEVTTAAEGTANARTAIATDTIAKSLYDALLMKSFVAENFRLDLMGSTIYVRRLDYGAFEIGSTDGLADKGLRIIKDKVETMDDLPARARHGMVLEVVGQPGNDEDNVWVQYEYTGDSEGLWRECAKPGVLLDFDNTTLPHQLVRLGKVRNLNSAVPFSFTPSVAKVRRSETEVVSGWTTDENDQPINDDLKDDVERFDDAYGQGQYTGVGMRSPEVALPGPERERKVTATFDVDTTGVAGVTSVQLGYNPGTGWETVETLQFEGGRRFENVAITKTLMVPSGSRFELRVRNTTRRSSHLESQQPRVTGHGSQHYMEQDEGPSTGEPPAGLVVYDEFTRINFGDSDRVWPMGTVFQLDSGEWSLTYTLPADATAEEVAQAIHTEIMGSTPPFISTVSSGPIGTGIKTYHWIALEVDGSAVDVTASASLDPDVYFWNPQLALTPDEYVGLEITNTTDESTGTITKNSGTCLKVDALTGGTANTFSPGDVCRIIGAGQAVFTFCRGEWESRKVGDDEANPYPSFIEKRISEVFFYGGRLGFTADDHICMSAVDDPTRFWRRTVTQLLPDDPIDIQSALKDVGALDSALEWNGQLLINSSAGHQMALTADGALTAATVKLEKLASYPVADKIRPLPIGASVLFPSKDGDYTHVRELFTTTDGSYDSRPLTDHVLKYIPGDCVAIAGDGGLGFVALAASGDVGAIYVCSILNVGEEQITAWNRWTFGGRVVGLHFSRGYLYIALFRGTGTVMLERVNVAAPSFTVEHKDASGSYSYTFRARLNRPFLKDAEGNPVTRGRTQVRTMEVAHHDSGTYRIVVQPSGRGEKQYTVTTANGRKRVPILAANDAFTVDIINDGVLGCGLASMEWEATFGWR